jgi:hypothetical protein
MKIVEVRFIKDSQSVATGNEFYPAGASAHFYANQASVLVDQGRAKLVKMPPSENPPPLAPAPDFSAMTVKALRQEAKAAGLDTKKMRKADLIIALRKNYEEIQPDSNDSKRS